MNAIAVVGSLNMDLVVRSERLPAPGETVLGGPFDTFAGGKGANQAVAAARLGATVTMIGAVGDDDHGAALRAALERDGVACRLAVRRGVATGVALITVDAQGENTIVVAAGANGTVDAALVRAHAETIAAADALLCQLEVPLDAIQHAVEIAREHAVRVVLNAAPARALPAALLRTIDVLVVNRSEAITLSGLDPSATVDALGRALVALGPPTIVITLGREGAVAVDAHRVARQPAFPVVAIDAVGAGDAFTAALTVELAGGQDIAAALRIACAAGAVATTRHGAQASLPTRDELGFAGADGPCAAD